MLAENLSPAAISRNLETDFIGKKVIGYPSLDSTNNAAKEAARKGAPEGTVIFAEEQTGGRGRIKRGWLTPKGNIALSIILRPNPSHLPSLIMVASLAVAHCIEKVSGLKAQIKWPNDVLIDGKKVCGILIESDIRGSAVDYAVIGTGLNVNLKPADFSEISSTATSLSRELGRELALLEVIHCLLVETEKLYLALPEGDAVYREWRHRLVTLGQKVVASSREERYQGIAESVARDGSLLLRQPDGSLVKIVAGDVTLRR